MHSPRIQDVHTGLNVGGVAGDESEVMLGRGGGDEAVPACLAPCDENPALEV